MKLIHLSIISIIGCLAGLVILMAAAIYSLDRMHDKQAEVADILDLQKQINEFSVASDSMLLFSPDNDLWRAFKADADRLVSRLQRLGEQHPDARKSVYHIKRILNQLAALHGFAPTAPSTRSPSADTLTGPLAMPPRSRIVMNLVAGHGTALDAVLNNVLEERRQVIARQANLMVGTFAGLAALFGALAVLAFILIHRRMATPARKMVHMLEAIRSGSHDIRVPETGDDELADVGRTLNRLLDEQQAADNQLRQQQRELENRQRILTESQRIAHIGSWQLDIKTNQLTWSEETYRIMGVSPDTFRPTVEDFAERVHPDDRERLLAQRASALNEQQPHDIQFRIIRPDGAIRLVHERAVAELGSDGEVQYFTGTIQDVTEDKQNEAYLLQYRTMVEGSDELYGVCDDNYRYVMVNQAYAQWHGYTQAEMVGRTLPECLGKQYFADIIQPYIDRCLAGARQIFEVERVNSAGELSTLLLRNYAITSPVDGSRQVAAIITDITVLREQEKLIQTAGRIARFGGWSVDLQAGLVKWSDMVAELHGMPHGYSPTIEEGIRFYVPEHRERIRSLFTACVEQGIAFDKELQILNQQGEPLWIRTIGEPVHDTQGEIIQVQGAVQDISAQRAIELELEQLNAQLSDNLQSRQALINALPAHIALLDSDGNILDVNEQWQHFGSENANTDPDFGVGSNYLTICASATGDCQAYAAEAGRGLRSLLDGEQDTFSLEYPCHSPDTYRWFRLMANRLEVRASAGRPEQAVVMHIDITERKLAEQELNRLAYQDALTGLPSRNGFVRSLEAQLEQTGWPSNAMVLMLDIDQLREVNDTHGYEAGDQLLGLVAQRLRERAGQGGLVGRIGGDEFAVYLPGQAGDAGEQASTRLASAFDAPYDIEYHAIEMDAKFGYTLLGEHARSIEDLLREAELALFRSRHQGPQEAWIPYTAELDRETHDRIAMARDLRRALDNQEFQLHFQPKVALSTGRLVAAEALLRWHHPERGPQFPARFIPVAEQSQLIAPIGDWAVDEACRYLRQWQDAGLNIVQVSVNVSLVQFTLGNFAATVRQSLQRHAVSPAALALEITESVFERESPELLQQLRQLHAMGVRLSLDDFGTGYSSLLYLQQYPFDEIKIDKGFVYNLVENAYSRSIVTTVMGVAGALQAEVVAEGVESAAARDMLLGLGCELGQGYYFSMPLEAEDFRWLLESQSPLPLANQGAG